jgi:hypothetical protein
MWVPTQDEARISHINAGIADIFVMSLRCGGEGSCDHYLFAVPGRCFGLPLYSAIAREALAARLGLLPLGYQIATLSGSVECVAAIAIFCAACRDDIRG